VKHNETSISFYHHPNYRIVTLLLCIVSTLKVVILTNKLFAYNNFNFTLKLESQPLKVIERCIVREKGLVDIE